MGELDPKEWFEEYQPTTRCSELLEVEVATVLCSYPTVRLKGFSEK